MVRLYEIWQAAVNASHDHLTEDGRREVAMRFIEHKLPGDEITVAENGAGICGFMGWKALDDGAAKIDHVAVDPDDDPDETGQALIRCAQERHNALKVEVNAGARAILAFYETLGFEETGRSPAAADTPGDYPTVHLRWTNEAGRS